MNTLESTLHYAGWQQWLFWALWLLGFVQAGYNLLCTHDTNWLDFGIDGSAGNDYIERYG